MDPLVVVTVRQTLLISEFADNNDAHSALVYAVSGCEARPRDDGISWSPR